MTLNTRTTWYLYSYYKTENPELCKWNNNIVSSDTPSYGHTNSWYAWYMFNTTSYCSSLNTPSCPNTFCVMVFNIQGQHSPVLQEWQFNDLGPILVLMRICTNILVLSIFNAPRQGPTHFVLYRRGVINPLYQTPQAQWLRSVKNYCIILLFDNVHQT